MLVERVSGMTLQAFCRKEFFEPLGINATQWRDDFRRIVPNRAIAYAKREAEWRQLMPFEDIYGNGGHGGGLTARGGIPFGTWTDRFVDWFRDLGFLQKHGVPTKAATDVEAFARKSSR